MRYLRLLAWMFALLLAAGAGLLLAMQEKMIYFPRPYLSAQQVQLHNPEKRIMPLSFFTSQGEQQAYYIAPRSGSSVRQLWVLFGGNGSLALDWLSLVHAYPDADAAFLLIDYPSYGACGGRPSSATIAESANAALDALIAHLGRPADPIEMRVLGHSLGAANALAFACNHRVSRVVLVAPFSSLRDMAQRMVGWPLCYLLRDNYDNRARLRELCARPAAMPAIEILSGTKDELIPFTMGRELAGISPHAHFQPIEAAGHNDILGLARNQIYAAMSGRDGQSR